MKLDMSKAKQSINALGLLACMLLMSISVYADTEGCDLHQTHCKILLSDDATQSIQLSIAPQPIKTMTPLELKVRLAGIEAERLKLDFSGVEMYMGINQTQMLAQDDGSFSGNIILPACMSNQMTWQVKIFVDASQDPLPASFFFKTGR